MGSFNTAKKIMKKVLFELSKIIAGILSAIFMVICGLSAFGFITTGWIPGQHPTIWNLLCLPISFISGFLFLGLAEYSEMLE